MTPRYSIEDAREALRFCDPGTDRSGWVRVMAAAKAAGLDEADALEWSAAAPNFKGERDVKDAWRSIKADGRVQAGTLFHEARRNGWKPTQGESDTRPVIRATAPAPRPVEPARPPRWTAAEVWSTATQADHSHGYVVRKNGTPEGLRVCAQPVRIGGVDMVGALLVPVHDLKTGELLSLQCVPAQGPKMNLPGHRMAGVFIVGDLNPHGTAYLVEGIGQAWACWQATGDAAVVAFGWGRVRAVAGELRTLHPGLSVVLVPDAGKEADAAAIAQEVGAAVAAMPQGSPSNFDANDLAQRDGFDALEVLLSSASEPPKPEPRFKLLGAADLRDLPPLAWRVRGVLPAVGLAALYGPSASGKSFLGFDLAAAVAEGCRWFGCRVEAAPVVYVALEGEAGFKLRAAAWEQSQDRPVPDALRLGKVCRNHCLTCLGRDWLVV